MFYGLWQQQSAFDSRNQSKRKICFLKSGRLFLLICSFLFLPACGRDTVSTSAEMLEMIAEQYKVIGNFEELGRIEKDGSLLLIGTVYHTGGKVVDYYAAEFSEIKDGQYQFEHNVTILCQNQSGLGKWKDGYAIVCCHPDVSTIHFALSANGKYTEGDFEVAEIPFVHYLSLPALDIEPNYHLQVSWLDSDGNEI